MNTAVTTVLAAKSCTDSCEPPPKKKKIICLNLNIVLIIKTVLGTGCVIFDVGCVTQ